MFIDKNIICYIEILDLKIVILKTCKIPVVEVLFVLLIILFYTVKTSFLVDMLFSNVFTFIDWSNESVLGNAAFTQYCIVLK